MGWIISLAFIIVYFQHRNGVNADVILISAGLFAIAGGLGSVARNIYALTKK